MPRMNETSQKAPESALRVTGCRAIGIRSQLFEDGAKFGAVEAAAKHGEDCLKFDFPPSPLSLKELVEDLYRAASL